MKHRDALKLSRILTAVLAFATILSLAPAAGAQTVKLIAGTSFNESNVVFDSAGNLYGTSAYGGWSQNCGRLGCGTVFELSPASDGTWTSKTLYTFIGGSDGDFPLGGLVLDAAGNLYGTTSSGGGSPSCTCGTVFKLSRTSSGTWKKSQLHRFSGPDGQGPTANLIFDSAGNLYGTTTFGGKSGNGTVFTLSPISGGHWNETVLYSFSGKHDGAYPLGTLVFDKAGNLYGATGQGGTSNGSGVIFRLSHTSTRWTETVLHAFLGKDDGGFPDSGVILDAAGNVYGVASDGGAHRSGVVFELSQNSTGGWQETVLYAFAGNNDGGGPEALSFDATGNLFGITNYGTPGGFFGAAQVFKLSPTSSGWSLNAIYPVSNSPSNAGLTFDSAGHIFLTDADDHYLAYGNVYELIP